MRLKQVLIANRMNVSFFLFSILMLSCAPLIFFNEAVWVIMPFVIALLLIVWVVYSSIAKKKLVDAKVIPDSHSDYVENLEKVFKPNSKLKVVFAAYGMSIAFMTVFCVLFIAISPEILDRYASPLSLFLVL